MHLSINEANIKGQLITGDEVRVQRTVGNVQTLRVTSSRTCRSDKQVYGSALKDQIIVDLLVKLGLSLVKGAEEVTCQRTGLGRAVFSLDRLQHSSLLMLKLLMAI